MPAAVLASTRRTSQGRRLRCPDPVPAFGSTPTPTPTCTAGEAGARAPGSRTCARHLAACRGAAPHRSPTPGRRSAGRGGGAALVARHASGACPAPEGGKATCGARRRHDARRAAGDLPAPGPRAGGRTLRGRPTPGHHRVRHAPTPGPAPGPTRRPAFVSITVARPRAREGQTSGMADLRRPAGHASCRNHRRGRGRRIDPRLFAPVQRRSRTGGPLPAVGATGPAAARQPGSHAP